MITSILLATSILLGSNRHHAALHRVKSVYLQRLPHHVAFSQDGRTVAIVGDDTAVVFSMSHWRQRRVVPLSAWNLAPVGGSSRFVTVGWNGKVTGTFVFGADVPLQQIELPSLGETTYGDDIVTSRDGKRLAVSPSGRKLLIYDLVLRKLIFKRYLGDESEEDLLCLDSGFAMNYNYPLPNDSAVSIYSANLSLPPITRIFPSSHAWVLAYSLARRMLYIGFENGNLFTLDQTGRNLHFLCRPRRQRPECLSVSPDGSLVAVGYRKDLKRDRGSNLIILVSGRTGRILARDARTEGVQGLAFAPDGKTLAETDRDGYLHVFRCYR